MNLNKKIRIEFVDEDIEKILKEQDSRNFLRELASCELKYNIEKMKRYATYLNQELEFPVVGHITIDSGLFGEEQLRVEIEMILEKEVRQGMKCNCIISKNTTKKISLHLIEPAGDENCLKNKELISLFNKWYKKNH